MSRYPPCAPALAVALAAAFIAASTVARAAPPPVLQTRPKEAQTTPGNDKARQSEPVSNAAPDPAATVLRSAAPSTAATGTTVLEVGMPLRIQLEHGYPASIGTRVEGHLIAPVYHVDHIVLPENTRVSGVIRGARPVSRRIRANALLDGDFTPLRIPEVTFDTMFLPDGTKVKIDTAVRERTIKPVHAVQPGKQSIMAQVKEQIRQRKQDAEDTITAPGKGDRVRRYAYGQLPYHPQRIWSGTQYDADLKVPLAIPDTARPMPVVPLGKTAPSGKIMVRLTTSIDSGVMRKGAPIEAVMSQPLLDKDRRQVLLPEGTRIMGSVLQVKPAAWWGRSGKIRFNFRSLEPVENAARETGEETSPAIHGQLTAAEVTAQQNLSIDLEGEVKPKPDKNKVLGPLLLGALAATSMDQERHGGDGVSLKNGVVSNGFGLLARVWTMTSRDRNVASGFAYFALSKSIYRHWIAKGPDSVLPRDTVLELQLASR